MHIKIHKISHHVISCSYYRGMFLLGFGQPDGSLSSSLVSSKRRRGQILSNSNSRRTYRAFVIGAPGVGKTAFARALCEKDHDDHATRTTEVEHFITAAELSDSGSDGACRCHSVDSCLSPTPFL